MGRRLTTPLAATLALGLAACGAPTRPPPSPTVATSATTVTSAPTASTTPSATTPSPTAPATPKLGKDGRPFTITEVARFDEPWAMTFLPGTNSLLVSQRDGTLTLRDQATGRQQRVSGVPDVVHSGQGGLGDIIAGPTFTTDRTVYLSWVERGDGGTGAAVGRARLSPGDSPALEGLTVIWRQTPKTSGAGHFSHRLAFSPDGRYLFVSSGDRQKMAPAQDLSNTLGTIVRLTPDGQPAPGNPFADRGGVSDQIWSYGHRNPLGLAFDASANLWSSEMGPQGGDELNLILPGKNYGWPRASNGSHYGGGNILDHRAADGFEAPKVWWTPSVSPGSLMIYTGDTFSYWRGDAFIGALSGEALIRVDLDGASASKGDEWKLGHRIREVEQGPDGSIWLLEDAGSGRLLRLTPNA